jgi:hypothetical protein
MSHFNIKSWEETSMNAKKREISQATGINLNLLKNEKNLINVNKSSFNSFANSIGINKNSQLDRYALYQSIKSIVNKKQGLNINNVEGVYFGKKSSYDMWKEHAKYPFPFFVKLIGQDLDARIRNMKVSNRVSDELKIVYKLLGGKDNPNKYPVYAINTYGNNDPFPPENLEKYIMKNQNRNRNLNQRTDSSGPFLAAGVTLGLIGTGVYFLLGI